MTEIDVLEKHPLLVDAETLRRTLDMVQNEIQLYKSIVKNFEERYSCDLATYQARIERGELPEHPSWENYIEWGVSADELERLEVIRKVLEWTLNFFS